MGSRVRAQKVWLTGLVAPQPVGSSWTRGRTTLPCVARLVLNYWTTRDAPKLAFEEPLWCHCVCLKPLSPTTRQFFNSPGALSQALDNMETIELFAGKKKKSTERSNNMINFENILLCERNQSQKTIYCMMWHQRQSWRQKVG